VLLTPGASDVVFDTLSYSAGPLPEQQLGDIRRGNFRCGFVLGQRIRALRLRGKRMEKMGEIESMEKVVRLEGVGHTRVGEFFALGVYG